MGDLLRAVTTNGRRFAKRTNGVGSLGDRHVSRYRLARRGIAGKTISGVLWLLQGGTKD